MHNFLLLALTLSFLVTLSQSRSPLLSTLLRLASESSDNIYVEDQGTVMFFHVLDCHLVVALKESVVIPKEYEDKFQVVFLLNDYVVGVVNSPHRNMNISDPLLNGEYAFQAIVVVSDVALQMDDFAQDQRTIQDDEGDSNRDWRLRNDNNHNNNDDNNNDHQVAAIPNMRVIRWVMDDHTVTSEAFTSYCIAHRAVQMTSIEDADGAKLPYQRAQDELFPPPSQPPWRDRRAWWRPLPSKFQKKSYFERERRLQIDHKFWTAREAIGLEPEEQLTAKVVVEFLKSKGVRGAAVESREEDVYRPTVINFGAGLFMDDTYDLIKEGWSAILIDQNTTTVMKQLESIRLHDPSTMERVRVYEEVISPTSVRRQTHILSETQHGVQYAKIDIDSFDCQVADALLTYLDDHHKPFFVTIEYMRSLPPPIRYGVVFHPNGTYEKLHYRYAGCSAALIDDIFRVHNYSLVQLGGPRGAYGFPDSLDGWPCGPDALLVRNDLVPLFGDISHDAYTRWVVDYFWRGGQADVYIADPQQTVALVTDGSPEDLLEHVHESFSQFQSHNGVPFVLSV